MHAAAARLRVLLNLVAIAAPPPTSALLHAAPPPTSSLLHVAPPPTSASVDTAEPDNYIPAETPPRRTSAVSIAELVSDWAPLVWLAPGERFLPTDVPNFLKHMTLNYTARSLAPRRPANPLTDETVFLTTQQSVDKLLRDQSSFLYGKNPQENVVPIYAHIHTCPTAYNVRNSFDNTIGVPPTSNHFHVTYWIFYPFNLGKTLCTIDTGMIGHLPIPLLFNKCYGKFREYGSHVGDWEHLTLYFTGHDFPSHLYISVHDAGAYYRYDRLNNVFKFTSQETRKGIMQKPIFPQSVRLLGKHPIVFAANGSHGLWSAPGKHKYVRVPRLYDVTGYGVPWTTWDAIEILDPSKVKHFWMQFRGHWGNEKTECHPLSKVGIDICHYFDGPTGIPMKRDHFNCSLNARTTM